MHEAREPGADPFTTEVSVRVESSVAAQCSEASLASVPKGGYPEAMAEVTVECHAGYRGDETPRRFHLGGRTIEITQILSRWKKPGAVFSRIRRYEWIGAPVRAAAIAKELAG